MSFNSDMKKACMDVRVNIFDRFRSELATIRQLTTDSEDIVKRNVAGLIGARSYRQYEGDLSPEQRTRLLSQIKADIGDMLKTKLLVVNKKSLKDDLLTSLDDLQAGVYRKETEKMAEIMADLLPEGTKISVDITQKELETLRKMPLAGLSIRDYTQKVLIEIYFGIIQSMSVAFTDAKTFEGGIKFGLADIGKKFETARNRIDRLAQELTIQASNQAMTDISAGFKFKRI